MSSARISVPDILCEFFEIVLHNILYARKLYPETIFVAKKKYGIAVHQSIHPVVNEYINQCLKAISFHAKNNRLKRLFVCFHTGEKIVEKYVFEVLNVTNSVESDPLLVDLEQALRSFILKLHTSQNYLDELPGESTFSVRIETTAYSSLEFNQEPAFEFRTNRLDLGDSSPSESELVIDDKPVKKKKNLLIRLTEEPLHLVCEWGLCEESFKTWKHFNTHLTDHATPELANLKCQWKGCKIESATIVLLMQHLSFHGYLSKLKNIGQNVLSRNNLPRCTRKQRYTEPIHPQGYTCDWEYCGLNFYTIHDFYTHMEIHIKNNPRVSKESLGEIIQCCWTGCTTKFSSQYKLAEHVRTHTKEKTVACPTCCALFSNKTKFCDHRKLQLSTHLQSYQCSQCLKLFPSERILRDHMRSHINHYKCTMCDMTCPKPSILAKHIRFKHVKDKPYKCTECTKTFVTKHNLLTHVKSHLDASMTCDQCDFKCRTKGALDNHNAKVHEKIRLSGSYECHCCKQRFRRGGYLTKHLMRVHNYHWPSGHSRFRYRKDQDNIHRLQTVRYESLEVTQEMIRSETMQTNNVMESVSYNLRYDDGQSEYVLSVSENGEQSVKATSPKQNNIIITINDVDEHGNILKSQVVESKEFIGVVKSGDVIISEQSSPNLTEVEGVINELDSIKSESANVIDIKDEPLRA